MNNDTDTNPGAAPMMPPPPGGGRWRVEGGQWVSNEPIEEAAEVPETLAEPVPPTEE